VGRKPLRLEALQPSWRSNHFRDGEGQALAKTAEGVG